MAVKIKFDTAHNPEEPTIVLSKRNGDKYGKINAKSIDTSHGLSDGSEMTFTVHKFVDNKQTEYWEQIVDFKLIHCVEWDVWFEIRVELDEATETIKTVYATQLGKAELSQINLYGVEINTENDIAREDYKIPTILYNINHPEASLLHRITEKAPHYKIIHVDETIANIQRTFTFNDISIFDSSQKISEEINCLFVLDSNSDENGKIQRTIAVYDLESNCLECGYRGEFTAVCPKCGSLEINEGYGEDTTIFITADELADNIQLSADTPSIKNCFKLEGGDDLMTATIRNCNPNGSDYIWHLSNAIKEDMSEELVTKIKSYDDLYSMYQSNYISNLDSNLIEEYNALVRKYKVYNSDLEEIEMPIIGYPALMNAYYNTIDLEVYLQSSLMPTVEISDTNALNEASKLTTTALSPVSTTSIANISNATADNIVLAMAKIIVDSRYRVKIANSSLDDNTKVWTGNFIVTNYSDEEDVATSEIITIVINDNYSSFIQQKLEKALNKDNTDDLSISGLFAKSYNEFADELKKYSLNYLSSFHKSCQSCIDILIEQGIGDKETWSEQETNLYNEIYTPYLNKLIAIESELKIRQKEIDLIVGVYDENKEIKTYGLQNYIIQIKNDIQKNLDFENYLGIDLWLEFCSYRRESKYSNSNYISDGLNNAELFSKAYEFIENAQKDIYKSAELQNSISTTLKNLLVIKKFEPLVKNFKNGNWMRIEVDSNIYKFRLVKYSINYNDLNNISVEFSDVLKVNNSIDIVKQAISQATSMASSYSAVQRQASQGEKSNIVVNDWIKNGLNLTNTKIISGNDEDLLFDRNGFWCRQYDSTTGTYGDEQIKIVNSTIAITDDNWNTTKTAIGKFYYIDPFTGEENIGFGINGEVIIGRFILGKNIIMQNESGNMVFDGNGLTITSISDDGVGTMTFDDNGLVVKHGNNTVTISPKSKEVMNITNGEDRVFEVNENGELSINGNIIARSLRLENGVTIDSGVITNLATVAVSGSYNDLLNTPTKLSDFINDGVFITKDANDLTNYYKKTETYTQTQIDSLLDLKANTDDLSSVATTGSYNDLIDKPNLSNVAISGSYNDLENTPDLSGIETNGQSILDILLQLESLNSQVEKLNNAVFDEV